MRAPDRLPPETRERLRHRRRRAEQARAALVRDLASRDLATLSRMPARIWNRLGPEGIVALIRTHRGLGHLAFPTPPAAPVRATAPVGGFIGTLRARMARWQAIRPLPVVTVAALLRGGAVSALLVAAALPARALLQETEWISRPAACPRLDRWTDGCVYTVRSDGLTLEQVTAALHRSPADLIATNPDVPFGRPLRRGTRIVISHRPLLTIAR